MVMTPFIIALLLTPVIICSYLQSMAARLGAIVMATTVFLAVLTGSTRVKSVELVVAGATFVLRASLIVWTRR